MHALSTQYSKLVMYDVGKRADGYFLVDGSKIWWSWRAAFADGRNSVQTRGRLFVRGALKELGTLTDGTTFAMQYCFLSLDLRF